MLAKNLTLFPGSGGRGDEPDARRDGPEELVCRHHENVPSFLNKEKVRWKTTMRPEADIAASAESFAASVESFAATTLSAKTKRGIATF